MLLTDRHFLLLFFLYDISYNAYYFYDLIVLSVVVHVLICKCAKNEFRYISLRSQTVYSKLFLFRNSPDTKYHVPISKWRPFCFERPRDLAAFFSKFDPTLVRILHCW